MPVVAGRLVYTELKTLLNENISQLKFKLSVSPAYLVYEMFSE